MPRGGQILRSGRYHLDAAGRLHRWRLRPTVAPVALVTVRARRMRVFPVPVESGREAVMPFDRDVETRNFISFDGFGEPMSISVRELHEDLAAPPKGSELIGPEAELALAPSRPRHTPLPKVSLKDAPSGMERLAERWRGAP